MLCETVSCRPPTCTGRFFEYHTLMDVTACGRADLQELDGENLTALRFEGIISTLPLGFAQGAAYSDINGNEVAAGTVRSRSSPCGEYRVTPTSDLTDKGFTGHAQNDEVALIYMRARYYVPGVGRFASADTIVPDPSSSDSYNRYAYAAGNPVKYRDPSGHCIPGENCPDNTRKEARYWRGMNEEELTQYQTDQGQTNNCGAYASTTAYNMLTGSGIDGSDMAELANLLWYTLSGTRTFPGQAILPNQQARLVNTVDDFAQSNNASVPEVNAEATKGTTEQLMDMLGDSNQVAVITMQWDSKWPDFLSGHAMVLAAYDPTHYSDDVSTPWGFINSHGSQSELYWMSDSDFQEQWGNNLLLIGSNNMVVIEGQKSFNPDGVWRVKGSRSFWDSLILMTVTLLLSSCSKGLWPSGQTFPDRPIVFAEPGQSPSFETLGFIEADGSGYLSMDVFPGLPEKFPTWGPKGEYIAVRWEKGSYFNRLPALVASAEGKMLGDCDTWEWGTGRVWVMTDETILLPLNLKEDGRERIVLADLNTCELLSTLYWAAGTVDEERELNASLSSQGYLAVSRIVTDKETQDTTAEVIIVHPETGQVQVIGEGLAPAWSRNGEWLAYTARDGIYIVQYDGESQKVVDIDSRGTVIGWSNSPPAPSWSPDGEWLVYHRRVSGEACIWKTNVETGEEIKLHCPGSYPDWRWD